MLGAGGSVLLERLDAAGQPLPNPLDEPAIVRFTGLVGHFSKWAVAIVSPLETDPPTGGTFAVNPPGPVLHGTPVTLSATGWTDASLPLSYRFFANGTPLADWQTASTLPVLLPRGTQLLTAQVRDALGNATALLGPLTVEVLPVTPTYDPDFPPAITPSTATAAARFSTGVRGHPGDTIRLETSTDLGLTDPWTVIGSIELNSQGYGEFLDIEDPDSIGLPRLFFRLRGE